MLDNRVWDKMIKVLIKINKFGLYFIKIKFLQMMRTKQALFASDVFVFCWLQLSRNGTQKLVLRRSRFRRSDVAKHRLNVIYLYNAAVYVGIEIESL